MGASTLTLADRVQALPPELFEEIFNLTLTIDTDYVKIDKTYQPPVQLQIDHASRESASASYYLSTAFEIRDTEVEQAAAWMRSLEKHNLARIERLYFKQELVPPKVPGPWGSDWAYRFACGLIGQQRYAWRYLGNLGRRAKQGCHRFDQHQSYINVLHEDDSGGVEEVWMKYLHLLVWEAMGMSKWSPLKSVRDKAALV